MRRTEITRILDTWLDNYTVSAKVVKRTNRKETIDVLGRLSFWALSTLGFLCVTVILVC